MKKQSEKTWRDLSQEPNDPLVSKYIRKTLLKARMGRIENPTEFLCEFVREHSVLDIGVVAHTIERTHDPEWKHNIIKKVAKSVVGVDILEDAVKDLQARDYDVRCVDATSDTDLGQRFTRIVIGDVIEHVDNPVALLRFAARHLAPGGHILCSTPNPFYIDYILESLRHDVFVANAEHVTWITPSMAMELAERAGVRLHSYWHIQGKGYTLLRKTAVKVVKLVGKLDSELFTGSFCYIFEHIDKSEILVNQENSL